MDTEVLEILKSLKDDVLSIKADMSAVKNTLDKHDIILVELNRKVDTVVEVQISASESMERAKEQDDRGLDDRLSLIEQVVTETSVIVKDIQKDLSRVELATANNWVDIAKLKAVK